jgi:hypothetical protein
MMSAQRCPFAHCSKKGTPPARWGNLPAREVVRTGGSFPYA